MSDDSWRLGRFVNVLTPRRAFDNLFQHGTPVDSPDLEDLAVGVNEGQDGTPAAVSSQGGHRAPAPKRKLAEADLKEGNTSKRSLVDSSDPLDSVLSENSELPSAVASPSMIIPPRPQGKNRNRVSGTVFSQAIQSQESQPANELEPDDSVSSSSFPAELPSPSLAPSQRPKVKLKRVSKSVFQLTMEERPGLDAADDMETNSSHTSLPSSIASPDLLAPHQRPVNKTKPRGSTSAYTGVIEKSSEEKEALSDSGSDSGPGLAEDLDSPEKDVAVRPQFRKARQSLSAYRNILNRKSSAPEPTGSDAFSSAAFEEDQNANRPNAETKNRPNDYLAPSKQMVETDKSLHEAPATQVIDETQLKASQSQPALVFELTNEDESMDASSAQTTLRSSPRKRASENVTIVAEKTLYAAPQLPNQPDEVGALRRSSRKRTSESDPPVNVGVDASPVQSPLLSTETEIARRSSRRLAERSLSRSSIAEGPAAQGADADSPAKEMNGSRRSSRRPLSRSRSRLAELSEEPTVEIAVDEKAVSGSSPTRPPLYGNTSLHSSRPQSRSRSVDRAEPRAAETVEEILPSQGPSTTTAAARAVQSDEEIDNYLSLSEKEEEEVIIDSASPMSSGSTESLSSQIQFQGTVATSAALRASSGPRPVASQNDVRRSVGARKSVSKMVVASEHMSDDSSSSDEFVPRASSTQFAKTVTAVEGLSEDEEEERMGELDDQGVDFKSSAGQQPASGVDSVDNDSVATAGSASELDLPSQVETPEAPVKPSARRFSQVAKRNQLSVMDQFKAVMNTNSAIPTPLSPEPKSPPETTNSPMVAVPTLAVNAMTEENSGRASQSSSASTVVLGAKIPESDRDSPDSASIHEDVGESSGETSSVSDAVSPPKSKTLLKEAPAAANSIAVPSQSDASTLSHSSSRSRKSAATSSVGPEFPRSSSTSRLSTRKSLKFDSSDAKTPVTPPADAPPQNIEEPLRASEQNPMEMAEDAQDVPDEVAEDLDEVEEVEDGLIDDQQASPSPRASSRKSKVTSTPGLKNSTVIAGGAPFSGGPLSMSPISFGSEGKGNPTPTIQSTPSTPPRSAKAPRVPQSPMFMSVMQKAINKTTLEQKRSSVNSRTGANATVNQPPPALQKSQTIKGNSTLNPTKGKSLILPALKEAAVENTDTESEDSNDVSEEAKAKASAIFKIAFDDTKEIKDRTKDYVPLEQRLKADLVFQAKVKSQRAKMAAQKAAEEAAAARQKVQRKPRKAITRRKAEDNIATVAINKGNLKFYSRAKVGKDALDAIHDLVGEWFEFTLDQMETFVTDEGKTSLETWEDCYRMLKRQGIVKNYWDYSGLCHELLTNDEAAQLLPSEFPPGHHEAKRQARQDEG